MPSIVINNPNEQAVDVRVVGKGWFLGLGGVSKVLHVGASATDTVDVRAGRYRIRYQFQNSSDVWEGDSFSLESGATATITLQSVAGGNYGTRPSSGKL